MRPHPATRWTAECSSGPFLKELPNFLFPRILDDHSHMGIRDLAVAIDEEREGHVGDLVRLHVASDGIPFLSVQQRRCPLDQPPNNAGHQRTMLRVVSQ